MYPNLHRTVFTWGNEIYNPGGITIPDDLMEHEKTHTIQQGATFGGAQAWWDRYCIDRQFRLEQEAEAYANQYSFLCKKIKDGNFRNKILVEIANILAGETYGKIVKYSEAMEMIKKYVRL